MLKLLILVAFLPFFVNSAFINFNYNYSNVCSSSRGGCYWEDPAIWIGNVAPTASDVLVSIFANSSTPNDPTLLNFNGTYILTSIRISGAIILFKEWAGLTLTNMTAGFQGEIRIHDYAEVMASQIQLLAGSRMVMVDNTILTSTQVFFLDSRASLFVGNDTTLNIGAVTVIQGNMTIERTAYVTGAAILFYSAISTASILNFDDVYFLGSRGNFSEGMNANLIYVTKYSEVHIYKTLEGVVEELSIDSDSALYLYDIYEGAISSVTDTSAGTLVISNCPSLTLSDSEPSALLPISLVFEGTSNIYLAQMVISNIQFARKDKKDPEIAFYMLAGVTLSPPLPLDIPGNVSVIDGGSIFFSGSFKMRNLTIYGGNATLNGDITVSGTVSIENEVDDDDVSMLTLLFESSITAGSINNTGYLVNYGASITAHVHNHGGMDSYYYAPYVINGNFSQKSTGVFTIYDINATETRVSPCVNVAGYANISGQLQFSTIVDSKLVTSINILHAKGKISGKFKDTTWIGDSKTEKALTYDDQNVYLSLHPEVPKKPMNWWIWLVVIGITFLSVILVAGSIVYFCAIREKEQLTYTEPIKEPKSWEGSTKYSKVPKTGKFENSNSE